MSIVIIVNLNNKDLYAKIEGILASRERARRTYINDIDVTMADGPDWVLDKMFEAFDVQEYLKHTLIRSFRVEGKDILRFKGVVRSNNSRFKIYFRDKVFVVRKKIDICQFMR